MNEQRHTVAVDSGEMAEWQQFSRHLAELAASIIKPYFRNDFQLSIKADLSPVTLADTKAEEAMREAIMRHFPDHGILGEEFGHYQPDAEYQWVLDPIDGTKGFLRGEQYAVALALIENGRVVLGVLGCPNFPLDPGDPEGAKGCLFMAVKNRGARMRPFDDPIEIPIGVTEIDDPSIASFCESVESAHSSHSDAALISQILGVTAPPIRIDSQCKYAALARGDASIYMRLPTSDDYLEKIWDHAAGWIIVKEAGGEVTDVYGKPLDFSLGRELRHNTGILGTNGKLHPKVVKAVGQVLESKM